MRELNKKRPLDLIHRGVPYIAGYRWVPQIFEITMSVGEKIFFQLVDQVTLNHRVRGSNPLQPTYERECD